MRGHRLTVVRSKRIAHLQWHTTKRMKNYYLRVAAKLKADLAANYDSGAEWGLDWETFRDDARRWWMYDEKGTFVSYISTAAQDLRMW